MFWDFILFSKEQTSEERKIKSWRTFSNSITENSIKIINQTFKEIEGVISVALESPNQCTKVV
jgi:hypothetical protein